MKKFLLLAAIGICSLANFSYGQKQKTDDKILLNSYTKAELNAIKQNPLEYEILSYALSNGTYIIDQPKDKDVSMFPELRSERPVDANSKLLFTDFGIKITDRSQYFRIVGQNKLLIVKSSNTLKLELSKSSSHE